MDRPSLRPRSHPASLAVVAVVVAVSGCSRVGAPSLAPMSAPPPAGWSDVGTASWYGDPFHGRITASGDVYDMEAMTAAHRTLPFGTVLHVENLSNGRTTRVTVNDRGPFVGNRKLDLSRRAARELDMIGPGTATVRMTVVGAPSPGSCWIVQVGVFDDASSAGDAQARMATRGIDTLVTQAPNGTHRVRAGPFERREDAERVAADERGTLLGCATATS